MSFFTLKLNMYYLQYYCSATDLMCVARDYSTVLWHGQKCIWIIIMLWIITNWNVTGSKWTGSKCYAHIKGAAENGNLHEIFHLQHTTSNEWMERYSHYICTRSWIKVKPRLECECQVAATFQLPHYFSCFTFHWAVRGGLLETVTPL